MIDIRMFTNIFDMKKLMVLYIALASCLIVNAQVLDRPSQLKKGQFSIGIEPAILIRQNNSGLILFLQGGAGLTGKLDLGIKYGVSNGDDYFGVDLGIQPIRFINISFGAHNQHTFGLDGTALLTIPISAVKLFAGFDLDLHFYNDVDPDYWLPVGITTRLRSNLELLLEADIALDNTYNAIAGGLNVRF